MEVADLYNHIGIYYSMAYSMNLDFETQWSTYFGQDYIYSEFSMTEDGINTLLLFILVQNIKFCVIDRIKYTFVINFLDVF